MCSHGKRKPRISSVTDKQPSRWCWFGEADAHCRITFASFHQEVCPFALCYKKKKNPKKHLFTDMFFLKTHLFTFLLQCATKTHLPINTLVLLHCVTKTRLFINKCFPFALCEKSITTWNEVKIKSSGQSTRIALLRNAVWSWKIIWPIDLLKIFNPNPHQKFTASPPV